MKRQTAEARCTNAACGWHNQRNVQRDADGVRLAGLRPCGRCGSPVYWSRPDPDKPVGPTAEEAAEPVTPTYNGQVDHAKAPETAPAAAEVAAPAPAYPNGPEAANGHARGLNGHASEPPPVATPAEAAETVTVAITDEVTGEHYEWALERVPTPDGPALLLRAERQSALTGQGVTALLEEHGYTAATFAGRFELPPSSVARAVRDGLDEEAAQLYLRRLGVG
jgi:hypothetical protein